MVGDCDSKYSKFELKCIRMSSQNLKNFHTNKTRPCNLSKPITYSNLYHRHHNRTVPKISDKIFRQQQPKGIIFVWPQRKKHYYERELRFLTKLIAHVLYWLHIGNLFPGCAGIILKQPPWNYKPPIWKPDENRNFVIEPDWNSLYL